MTIGCSVFGAVLDFGVVWGYFGVPFEHPVSPSPALKKPVGKTKEELALEKKRELEKRLQDVSGQLNSAKKPPKKGERLSR